MDVLFRSIKIDHSVYQDKMPTCCFVPGCSTRGGHNFPTDENKRKAWVLAINRKEGDKKGKAWIPSNSSVVCRRHFLPTDYKEKKMTTGLSHPGLEEISSPAGGGKEVV